MVILVSLGSKRVEPEMKAYLARSFICRRGGGELQYKKEESENRKNKANKEGKCT
jgi:hypothetical protein